ncbi:hypothetical protein [Mycolicibacterium sp.]|uniref:hypothetical protein n=1 Tax=Mycolicibacterium sp. TaxID=2320850 RepID=UPI003D0AAB7F
MTTVDDLVREVIGAGARTVVIDGRSGAGKSTLADDFGRRWPAATVVRLDDIYPGWDGLAWAVAHLRTELLEPRAAGRPGRWRRWDWTTGTAADWHRVGPDQRLVVEGVGTLAAADRELTDLGIWLDCPDALRKQRALSRDGDTYRPHWDRWAAQEDALIAWHDPRSAADYIGTETPGGWTFTRAGGRTPAALA